MIADRESAFCIAKCFRQHYAVFKLETPLKGARMRTLANIALGVAVGGAVACLVVHRRVVIAIVTGRPVPEPPEWHKAWHPLIST